MIIYAIIDVQMKTMTMQSFRTMMALMVEPLT